MTKKFNLQGELKMQSNDFEKVSFESRGETLVGNLYLPETEKKRPGSRAAGSDDFSKGASPDRIRQTHSRNGLCRSCL
jgi:hypothetical protein